MTMHARSRVAALVAVTGLALATACADDGNESSPPSDASTSGSTSPVGTTATVPETTGSTSATSPATEPAPPPTLPATDPAAEATVVGLYGLAFAAAAADEPSPFPRYLELAAGGEGHLYSGDGTPKVESFSYAVAGDLLSVQGGDRGFGCGEGAVGTYAWTSDTELVLSVEDEPCVGRARLLAPDPMGFSGWIPLDVPLLDGEYPVEVDSPIGTITWTPWSTDLDPNGADPLSGLASTDSAFVELVSVEGRNVLRSSTDGVTWTELPAPPDVPRLLIVDGPTVTVVVGDESVVTEPTWPLSMYTTDDLGATWRPIEVEPPPDGMVVMPVGGFDVGGAGGIVPTMVVGGDGGAGPVWIGDGGRLEMVDAPPWAGERSVEARSLDSGFLVRSGDGDDLRMWTSSDGRAWTPVEDPPCSLYQVSTTGDTAYGTDCNGQVVVSEDAGATWSAAAVAPPLGQRLELSADRAGVVQNGGWFCGGWLVVSADEQTWSRVFEPWPPVLVMGAAAMDDLVLLRTLECSSGGGPGDVVTDWLGTFG